MNAKGFGKLVLFFAFMLLLHPLTHAEETDSQTKYTVTAPYLELRSGPARGYPILFTLKYHQQLQILSRKTQWLKVKTEEGDIGWIQEKQLNHLSYQNQAIAYSGIDRQAYQKKQLEFGFYTGGVNGGANDNTPLIATSIAWQFTELYSTELTYHHMLGNNEENFLLQLDLQHTLAPEWPISPTFNIGLGQLQTKPKSTLGDAKAIESNTANFGIGFKYPIQHRFVLRGDYNKHLIISNKNQLDSVLIWKLGISIFF
ncbi:MAG: SH3 domain-containing protein [Pseudomonadales bacterium]|nr:SH3 domain-containing protein [Pseudomonadales bacterium]